MTAAAIVPEDFPWFDFSRYSFSLGLSLNGEAILSGHSASEYDRAEGRIVVNGGMAEQTRTAYAKIECILAAAGLGFEDVHHLVENVTVAGIGDYAAAEAVRANIFPSSNPVVNTVVVERLLRPAALIEIEVEAGLAAQSSITDETFRPGYADSRQAGGLVLLSTILPWNREDERVGVGSLAEQTEMIYMNAAVILERYGLSLAHVALISEVLRPEALFEYDEVVRCRRKHLGPVYPAVNTVVQRCAALDQEVLLACDIVAAGTVPTPIDPGWPLYAAAAVTPGVKAGRRLFISTQTGNDPVSGKQVSPGNVLAQAGTAYDNVNMVLNEAGLTPDSLIKTVEHVTGAGLESYRGVAEVRRKVLSEPYPASTGALCFGLLEPRMDFAVHATAVVGD